MITGGTMKHLLLFMILCVTGCTQEKASGDITVYQNSWLMPLIMLLAAAGFAVIGAGIFFETYRGVARSQRKKKKRQPLAGRDIGGLLAGCGLMFVGGIFLLVGLPSSMLARITVSSEELTLRDDLLWFSERPLVLPYSSVVSINYDEREVWSRRGRRKKTYMIIGHAGGVEEIEMNPIHHAAKDRVDQAYKTWKDKNGAPQVAQGIDPKLLDILGFDPTKKESDPIVQGNQGQLPNQPAPIQNPQSLTETDRIGRYHAGVRVTAKNPNGGFTAAVIVRINPDRSATVRFENSLEATLQIDEMNVSAGLSPMGTAEPGTEVTKETEVVSGMRLLGLSQGGWYPAQVHSLDGPTHVVVIFDGETGRHSIPRSWVRLVPENELKAHYPKS